MAQYELNLSDYWRVLKKRRWVIFVTLLAVLGSVTVLTNLQTPIYQATATVKVEPNMSIPGVVTDQMYDSYTALNTEVKIIKSTIVAERAALKLGLLSDDMTPDHRQAVVGAVLGKISAERVGDTNLITISATSSNPAETAKVANTTAEVYIEKGIEDRNRRARELREFVEIQLRDAEEKLKSSEDELKRYTEKSGAKGVGGYMSTRLVDLETKKGDLLKRYTEQHPEVQRLEQQIQNIESQMKQLPTEELEYARLNREVNINEELYTLLSKRYKEAQISEADRVQSAFVVTPATEPTSPTKPNKLTNITIGALLGIFLGLLFALIIENLDTSIGTIEDVEKFLGIPVLGIIPHIEAEKKQKKFFSRPQVHEKSTDLLRLKLIVNHSTKSPFVEAYHTLRTNLTFSLLKKTGNIIAFTSAGIGEGKTVTSSNFALAAAQSGIKTLLVEADLRRPILHRIFGLKRDPGFTDCLIGTRKWQDVARGTTDFLMSELNMEKILQFPGIENLKVITSGPIPPNPVDLFNSPGLKVMLDEMARQYELVVLDCPPALLFADPLIVGTKTTGTILVYRAGNVPRGALKRAKEQLSNVKVPVIGVVLNDITSSEMEPHYGYYFSYKYYDTRNEAKKQENA